MSQGDRRMLLIGLPAGAVAGVAAGILSQMAFDAWSVWTGPFAVGLAAGATVGVVSLLLRCPRMRLVLALGVAGAAAGNAASWWQAVRAAASREFVWEESERDFRRRQDGDMILHGVLEKRPPLERRVERARPRGLGEYLDWRLRHGWPEHGESHARAFVALIYVGELLLSMFMAAIALGTAFFSRPYCMTHRQWAKRELTVIVGDIDLHSLSKSVEAGSIDAVVAAPRSKGSRCVVTYVFQRCPACDSTRMTLWLKARRAPVLEEVPVTPEQVQACCQAIVRPVG